MGRVDKSNTRWIPLLVAFLMTLSLVALDPAPAHAAISREAFERCLLDKANQARSAKGVAPLQMAGDLVPGVRNWSQKMRSDGFKHMPGDLRQDILPSSWKTWGENIAMHGSQNMSDCGPIHTMWMNSTGHRANILNPNFRFVAIGTYVDSSGWWATQLFFDASGYAATGYGAQCGPACSDEMFFYREDGLYRYYDINSKGTLGKPILKGNNYTKGWDSITAVDLDGDGKDEMFFYREDGLYRYYDINSKGALGKPILEGNNYTKGWDSITAVDLR